MSTKGAKPHTSVVVFGHVDAGKTLLGGCLIYECGGIDARLKARIDVDPYPQYCRMIDCWRHRRSNSERDITIEPRYAHIKLCGQSVTLWDTPGHSDFFKNMLTGMALSDIGVFTVAASVGEFEAGAGPTYGTMRNNVATAFTLGISYLVIAVNKMDDRSIIGQEKARFEEIEKYCLELAKKVGYPKDHVLVVPCSGWTQNNIASPPTGGLGFYSGPTVVQALETLVQRRWHDESERLERLRHVNRIHTFLMSIYDVYKIGGIGTVLVGKVIEGSVKVGESIAVGPTRKEGPSGESALQFKVKSIEMHHVSLQSATEGDFIGIAVDPGNQPTALMKDPFRIKRGCFVVGGSRQAPVKPAAETVVSGLRYSQAVMKVDTFEAGIVVTSKTECIRVGSVPLVHCGTSRGTCRVLRIISKAPAKHPDQVVKDPTEIRSGESGIAVLQPYRMPFFVRSMLPLEHNHLSRLILRNDRLPVAVGSVKANFLQWSQSEVVNVLCTIRRQLPFEVAHQVLAFATRVAPIKVF